MAHERGFRELPPLSPQPVVTHVASGSPESMTLHGPERQVPARGSLFWPSRFPLQRDA